MYDSTATMEYNLNKPIDVIFNAVDSLLEISELVGRLYLSTQLVNLAYMIVIAQLVLRLDI